MVFWADSNNSLGIDTKPISLRQLGSDKNANGNGICLTV